MKTREHRAWPDRVVIGTCGTLFGLGALVSAGLADDVPVTVSPVVALNTNAAGDRGDDTNVRLFSDGGGRLIAVRDSADDFGGTTGADVDLLYAWSDDGGMRWTAPAPLNGDAATDDADDVLDEVSQRAPGEWYAVWHVSAAGDRECAKYRIARSRDNGATWSGGTATDQAASTRRDRRALRRGLAQHLGAVEDTRHDAGHGRYHDE